MTRPTWTLVDEMGGEDRLRAMLRRFYDRLFEDMIIGFFFDGKDKQALIDSQFDYVCANIGQPTAVYEGGSIRKVHRKLPILVGHFDRRHTILAQVLEEFDAPVHVQEAWLGLDRSLRELVLRTGGEAVKEMLE